MINNNTLRFVPTNATFRPSDLGPDLDPERVIRTSFVGVDGLVLFKAGTSICFLAGARLPKHYGNPIPDSGAFKIDLQAYNMLLEESARDIGRTVSGAVANMLPSKVSYLRAVSNNVKGEADLPCVLTLSLTTLSGIELSVNQVVLPDYYDTIAPERLGEEIVLVRKSVDTGLLGTDGLPVSISVDRYYGANDGKRVVNIGATALDTAIMDSIILDHELTLVVPQDFGEHALARFKP
jgi:hypothetical protein